MQKKTLTNYIKTGLAKGYGLKELRDNLLQKGYNPVEVDKAFKAEGYDFGGTSHNLSDKGSGSTKGKKRSNSGGENIIQPLSNYIKTGLAKGYRLDDLKNNLLQNGYNSEDIDKAVNESLHVSGQNVNSREAESSGALNKNDTSSGAGASNVNRGKPNIKRRNSVVVLILFLLTVGLYGLYWLISTTNELGRNTNSAPNPKLLWLFLIPLVNFIIFFVYFWKYCKAINELTGFSAWGLFVLWIFLGPVAIIVSQIQLNSKADTLNA
ncbi:MAG: DUF4234 domain-containing protein [Nanoarchaeota archaeon]